MLITVYYIYSRRLPPWRFRSSPLKSGSSLLQPSTCRPGTSNSRGTGGCRVLYNVAPDNEHSRRGTQPRNLWECMTLCTPTNCSAPGLFGLADGRDRNSAARAHSAMIVVITSPRCAHPYSFLKQNSHRGRFILFSEQVLENDGIKPLLKNYQAQQIHNLGGQR